MIIIYSTGVKIKSIIETRHEKSVNRLTNNHIVYIIFRKELRDCGRCSDIVSTPSYCSKHLPKLQ